MFTDRLSEDRFWVAIASLLGGFSTLRGADWPQWRGPERNGVSRETGLAPTWPADGPRLLWKADGLGEGFSTPAIIGGTLLTMGNRDGREYVVALDVRSTPKPLWATPIGPVRHSGAGYPGPRSTPTFDLGKVYALGMNGDLVCLDFRTGKPLWRHDLVAEFGGRVPTWGYSESPLVDGPWVLVTPGGAQATLGAFLKTTGKPVWGAAIGDGAGYASIVKAGIGGSRQYVQFTARGVVGVEAKSGAMLWRYDAPANDTANASTPLVVGDVVFAASGYGTGGGAVKIVRQGASFQADERFFTTDMINHHGGMVVLDGHVYGSSDPGILTCIELATGTTKWRERALGKGSLVAVDGRLITRSERGTVCLAKVSPEGCEIVGRFEQPDRSDKPAWPHPVVADGKLYLRDQDALWCYDVRLPPQG